MVSSGHHVEPRDGPRLVVVVTVVVVVVVQDQPEGALGVGVSPQGRRIQVPFGRSDIVTGVAGRESVEVNQTQKVVRVELVGGVSGRSVTTGGSGP